MLNLKYNDMSFNIPDRMQVSVTIPRDKNGMLGRECPKCKRTFKVKPGTGLKGKNLPCHCAYCGHVADNDQFYTRAQIEYAKSIAMNQFSDLLHNELKKLEFDHAPRGAFGIGISLKVKDRSPRYPVPYYYEKELETDVTCDQCTLAYAIYGAFAFCPDCGSHNSFTILSKNLELADKLLALAGTQERDVAEHLIGDALENVVSAFDGFGRELCRVAAPKATNPADAEDQRFQNLAGARSRVQKLFGFDLMTFVPVNDWEFACRSFQKRHLLAHKMGVIDDGYVQATKDSLAVVGRKVHITPEEVTHLAAVVRLLGAKLSDQLLHPTV